VHARSLSRFLSHAHTHTLSHAHAHTLVLSLSDVWYTCDATHCNTLQHTAAHRSTLQHTAAHRSTLQHTATHSILSCLYFYLPSQTSSPHLLDASRAQKFRQTRQTITQTAVTPNPSLATHVLSPMCAHICAGGRGGRGEGGGGGGWLE